MKRKKRRRRRRKNREGGRKQGSIYNIENHIPPPLSEIIFFPLHILYMQEFKNKHIFDHFFPVIEKIVFINFHFLSPSALSGGGECKI